MKRLFFVGCGIMGLAFLFACVGAMTDRNQNIQTEKKPEYKPTIDKSEEEQAKREKFIETLIRERVFTKVDHPASLPHVWIGPVFYGLDFRTKLNYVNVVWNWYFDGSETSSLVILYDSYSGKPIGKFSKTFGTDVQFQLD